MHRFFVLPHAIQGQQVRFSPEQTHQFRSVLRLRTGDEVLALDGLGRCYRVTLESMGKIGTLGRILETMPAGGEPDGDATLCQAISRGERFDWVLQKGTELGVTRFQPMITRRTVRRTPGDNQRQRWERILREAAEQCGRGRVPDLAPDLSFEEAVAQRQGLALLPSTGATLPARQVLTQATWPVTLFIGPEGGFAPEEVTLAREAGVLVTSLGSRTLRTETAAVVLLTLVMSALGELDRPAPLAPIAV